MGYRQFNEVCKCDAGKKPIGTRVTLMILANLAKHDEPNIGLCYPSYNWIANSIGCSRRTVQRAVKQLQKEGHLIARSWQEGGTTTQHYIVTTGLYDEEIKATLVSHFGQKEEDAEKIVDEVRKRQSGDFDEKESAISFFAGEVTKSPVGVDVLSPPTRQKVTPYRTKSDPLPDKKSPYSEAYSEADSEADSEARESRSLQKNQHSEAERPTNNTPGLSAKKGNNPKQNNFQDTPTTHAEEPPPSSAAPPPVHQMTEALRVACGFKEATNSRQRRRLKKKLSRTARELLADGYTPQCVATMRKWWDTVGIGSNPGRTPPHASQVEMYIDTALAWEKAGSQITASKQRGEYALAAEQPKRSQADVEATRKAYDEGLFEEEVNEYGF